MSVSTFRPFLSLAAVPALIAAATPALAGEILPFSIAAFQKAQAAGKPILVDAHADWCPTCRRQAPTISAISKDKAFAQLVILKLDYDTQRAEKQLLGVRQQSTLIAFSGKTETGRSTGVTEPSQIRALATSALRRR